MLQLVLKFNRSIAVFLAGLLGSLSLMVSVGVEPALAQGNGVNVILMIGDGMGWEMARAAAVARGGSFYGEGKGNGLSFQTLTGYTYATTYGTTIAGSTGNDARNPSDPSCRSTTNPAGIDCGATGAAPLRVGFQFNPSLNPGTPGRNLSATADQPCRNGGDRNKPGNIVGYEPAKGGPTPWTPRSPAQPGSYDPEYIKCSYPDSANTASALYTGEKSYNNAIAVDIYEQNLETILQQSRKLGKSTGLVTSVPITHATPGAATATVNRRNKYDNDYPALDNILQEAIRPDVPDADLFLPTVLIGGGHPLDFENRTATSTVTPQGFTYIRKSTYDYLVANPTVANRYGYAFLERDTKVTTSNNLADITDGGDQLLAASRTIDPNKGERLLGLYGARGQNGNIPTLAAAQDYSLTGLDNFSVYSTAAASTAPTGQPPNNGTQVPTPDRVRPLASTINETADQFIAKEVKANPTLAEMTQAALNVLGKDRDGFWLMVEGGDIDWAAHDNNLDNLIGTMIAFDNAVKTVIDWIGANGGWEKNVLIVTADHDHYLTLNPNYPRLLNQFGAKALTFDRHTPATAGHFWGSDPTIKYGWGNHSNRMVPVYYQGRALQLNQYRGKPVQFVDNPPGGTRKVYEIPGVPGAIDQTHLYFAMLDALTKPIRR